MGSIDTTPLRAIFGPAHIHRGEVFRNTSGLARSPLHLQSSEAILLVLF
jgi:hypothetical protein